MPVWVYILSFLAFLALGEDVGTIPTVNEVWVMDIIARITAGGVCR